MPKHIQTQNMSKTQNSQIPLDTLGHPLPPPVRPEHICRIPKRDWGKWWTRYYNNTLDKELDCSVCGLSFPEPTLIPLDRAILDPAIQKRALNTTGDRVRVCRGCKSVCSRCGGTIISAQRQSTRDSARCVLGRIKPRRERHLLGVETSTSWLRWSHPFISRIFW